MNLVDTPTYSKTEVKRKPDGKPDYDAYVGLDGEITENGLTVEVRVIGARSRYGHLDLNVTPKSGSGSRWVERKNINLLNDPAASPATWDMSTYLRYIATQNARA